MKTYEDLVSLVKENVGGNTISYYEYFHNMDDEEIGIRIVIVLPNGRVTDWFVYKDGNHLNTIESVCDILTSLIDYHTNGTNNVAIESLRNFYNV